MEIRELIKELSKFDPNLDVHVLVSVPPPQNCGCDYYCYCSYTEHEFSVNQINEVTKYDRKLKKHITTRIILSGE